MSPPLPRDPNRIPAGLELQRRLEENPDKRLLVIKDFVAERVAAGDGDNATWAVMYLIAEEQREKARVEHEKEVARLEHEKEIAEVVHEAEVKMMKRDQMSPLLKLIIVLGFIAGVIFGLLGIWLVYLGASGTTEVSFFGQTAKSTNVGIISIFLGAAIIVLLMRSILKTIRSG